MLALFILVSFIIGVVIIRGAFPTPHYDSPHMDRDIKL